MHSIGDDSDLRAKIESTEKMLFSFPDGRSSDDVSRSEISFGGGLLGEGDFESSLFTVEQLRSIMAETELFDVVTVTLCCVSQWRVRVLARLIQTLVNHMTPTYVLQFHLNLNCTYFARMFRVELETKTQFTAQYRNRWNQHLHRLWLGTL